MADGVDVKALMLTVDASVELLRKNLNSANTVLDDFGRKAEQNSARFDNAVGRINASSRQTKAGMQQLSFQLNDVATQFSSGTPPMIIFAQQSSQVLQAVQLMSGGASGLIGILAGPWGMALTAALVVMTPFVAKMMDGTTAAEENARALQNVQAASSGLSSAQSALGEIFDLTTGKIKSQNDMLRLNAQLLAGQLRAKAAMSEQTSQSAVYESGRYSWGAVLNGNIPWRRAWDSRNTPAQARLQGVVNGTLNPLDVQKWAERQDFSKLNISKADYIDAIMRAAEVAPMRKTAGDIEQSLKDNKLAPGLLKPDTSPGGRKGPSADTLARRTEAARVAMVNQDSAYTEQERRARKALIDATAKSASSEAERDALLKEEINAEADAAKHRIANDLSAKKITDAQAEHLTALAEQTRQQKLINVDLARQSQNVREAADLEARDYDNKISILQLQEGFAQTAKQRRDIQLQMLDLEEKRLKAMQQAIIDDPASSTEQRIDAMGRIQQINRESPLKRAGIERANASPMDAYRQKLLASTSDMNTALEEVQVRGLESLEDGLLGVIDGTKSVAGAFKDMANQIIADLARIAIEKMIVKAISGSGLFGGLFSEGGPVLKKAGGGFISGPGTTTSDSIPAWLSNGEYVIRAEAVRKIGLPALDAINSGRLSRFAAGGPVAPRVPRLSYSRSAANSNGVSIPITINAPGATAETVAMIRREIANATPMIAQSAAAMTTRHINRRRLCS